MTRKNIKALIGIVLLFLLIIITAVLIVISANYFGANSTGFILSLVCLLILKNVLGIVIFKKYEVQS